MPRKSKKTRFIDAIVSSPELTDYWMSTRGRDGNETVEESIELYLREYSYHRDLIDSLAIEMKIDLD